jgi:hypothetical protein
MGNGKYCVDKYCFRLDYDGNVVEGDAGDFCEGVFGEEAAVFCGEGVWGRVWVVEADDEVDDGVVSLIYINEGCLFQPGINSRRELVAAFRDAGVVANSSDFDFEWVKFGDRNAGYRDDNGFWEFFCTEDYLMTYGVMSNDEGVFGRLIDGFREV